MKLIPAGLLEAGGGQVASSEPFCGDQIRLNLIRLRLASPFVVTGRGWTGIRPTGTGFWSLQTDVLWIGVNLFDASRSDYRR